MSSIIFEKYKAKKAFVVAYLPIFILSIALVIITNHDFILAKLIIISIMRFSIAMAYQAIYLVNDLFPLIFSSTTFGLCIIMQGFG